MAKSNNGASGRAWAGPGTGIAGMQEMLGSCQPMLNGLADLNGEMVTGWMEVNREWTQFLMERVHEDVAFVHKLGDCKNPQEFFSLYATFYQKAFADYQNEFQKISKLSRDRFSRATHDLQESVASMSHAPLSAA